VIEKECSLGVAGNLADQRRDHGGVKSPAQVKAHRHICVQARLDGSSKCFLQLLGVVLLRSCVMTLFYGRIVEVPILLKAKLLSF
jgi:hypothetical protein